MRPISLPLGTMMLAAVFAPAAVAQDGAIGVATYIEVLPQSMKAGAALLETEAAASRKDEGCQDIEVLREIGRNNRFVVLESWKSQSAFDAHGKAQHVQQFHDQLGAIEAAPPDERILASSWQSQPKIASKHSIWVVTHVDVMPSSKDQASDMLKELGEGSVREPGNTRFMVAYQIGRPNHFTVTEIWADWPSFDVHQAADQTRHFRERISPMLGALYDQRIYSAVDSSSE